MPVLVRTSTAKIMYARLEKHGGVIILTADRLDAGADHAGQPRVP
ncbi:hypothetical protein [Micromonospora rhizosphaerae]|nr:hypothetical protein [Micromonospora rhizosphaerae]